MLFRLLVGLRIGGESRERGLEELADAFGVRRRDGGRRADAELVEFGRRRVGLHAFSLVDGEPYVRMPAQLLGDVAVAAHEPGAAVDDEDHRIGLGDRLLRLARHLHRQALVRARLEAAGIDGDEAPLARAAFAVMAIARHARQVVDDGVAAAGEAVKEGRLADVRAPDQRQYGLHNPSAYMAPLCVSTRSPPGIGRGAARTGPLPVA